MAGADTELLRALEHAIDAETGHPAGVLNIAAEATLAVSVTGLHVFEFLSLLVEALVVMWLAPLNLIGRLLVMRHPLAEPWKDFEFTRPRVRAAPARWKHLFLLGFLVLICPIVLIAQGF